MKKIFISLFVIMTVVLGMFFIFVLGQSTQKNIVIDELKVENEFFEALFELNALEAQSSVIGLKSLESYNLAMKNYDLEEYLLVISNCESAREYGSEYTQNIRESKYLAEQQEGILFDILSKMYSAEIEIEINRYEACEYIESAARQYEAGDYYGGDLNIEAHNEKIAAHDAAVNRHNTFLAEYSYELKNGGYIVG